MTADRPNGRPHHFSPDELDGVAEIRPDELVAEARLARDLEGVAARGGVLSLDFGKDVWEYLRVAFGLRAWNKNTDEPSVRPQRARLARAARATLRVSRRLDCFAVRPATSGGRVRPTSMSRVSLLTCARDVGPRARLH